MQAFCLGDGLHLSTQAYWHSSLFTKTQRHRYTGTHTALLFTTKWVYSELVLQRISAMVKWTDPVVVHHSSIHSLQNYQLKGSILDQHWKIVTKLSKFSPKMALCFLLILWSAAHTSKLTVDHPTKLCAGSIKRNIVYTWKPKLLQMYAVNPVQ